jgi:hypothetical protein
VRPPDRLRPGFAQPEVPDLAGLDQLADRPGDLLDRHLRVDAVLVEDVQPIGPQVPQAVLRDLADVLRPAVQRLAQPRVLRHVEPELGRQHDLVAEALHRLAEQLLVTAGATAVQLGGVEEVDPQLESAPDGGHSTVVVRFAVRHGHAHRAEPERGDAQSLPAECALLHVTAPQ